MNELDAVLKKIKKDFGEESGGKGVTVHPHSRIMTNLFPLDLATGGGLLQGKLNIVYGPESSGKTTVCLKSIAYVQHVLNKVAVFIDIEHTFDPAWAALCGVDTNNLVLLYPQTAEIAVDMVDATLRAEDVGIVVLDSIGSMITDNEIASDSTKTIVSGSALIVSKMVRKVTNAFMAESRRDHRPTFVAINQTRYKIGSNYGDPESMPGGNLLKFASCMTIRLYGKDVMVEAVSKDKPTFKKISGIIKKHKAPILSRTFQFEMCLIPHDGMQVTEADSWKAVSNYLKLHGVIGKDGTKWLCAGEEFKTLGAIEQRYRADSAYQTALETMVVEKELSSGESIPAEGD